MESKNVTIRTSLLIKTTLNKANSGSPAYPKGAQNKADFEHGLSRNSEEKKNLSTDSKETGKLSRAQL